MLINSSREKPQSHSPENNSIYALPVSEAIYRGDSRVSAVVDRRVRTSHDDVETSVHLDAGDPTSSGSPRKIASTMLRLVYVTLTRVLPRADRKVRKPRTA